MILNNSEENLWLRQGEIFRIFNTMENMKFILKNINYIEVPKNELNNSEPRFRIARWEDTNRQRLAIQINKAFDNLLKENEEEEKEQMSGKKFMIYGGCFCPPHKGHFNLVKNNYKKYDKIYICLYGDGSKRHNIPVSTSKQIWSSYVNLLKDNQNIKIKILPNSKSYPQLDCLNEMKNEISDGDTVSIYVGDDYTQPRINMMQREAEKIIRNQKINIIKIPRDQYSATQFMKDFIIYKQSLSKVATYIPKGVEDETIKLLFRFNMK